MRTYLRVITLAMTLLLLAVGAQAEKVSKEQIKGLDEQVQEIKSDVLSIAQELNQLEEKLIFPSNTQVSLFVSLGSNGKMFRLDSVDIQLDGAVVAHHLYTFKELEALRKGGVQRIYTGNILSGDHAMQVTLKGKTRAGSDFVTTKSTKVQKNVGPKVVEITLAPQSISFNAR